MGKLKSILILCCLVIFQSSFGQNKKITIVDKTTTLPLERVNLTYVNLNEGTFTNSDGVASLEFKKNDLKISMVGYDDIILTYEKIIKVDTLFLIQRVTQLEEVTVNSFKLKDAINYIIDNYDKLYVNVPFEKECIFKEKVIVNDNIKRLILTKVNWWDKSYERKKTDVKFRLGSIDYNKNEPLNIFSDVSRLNNPSTSGYIEPNSIMNTIYLNIFLNSFLNFTEGMTSYVEKSTDEIIDVHFESEWKKIGSSSYQHIGNIIFDKKTKAILNISFDTNQNGNIQKGTIKENNKESISETKKNSMRISFSKSLNNKFSLKMYETEIYLDITYNSKIFKTIFENKIYVLKETAMKKVNNDGLIDLTKPIFQSLPSKTISNSNSILLTKEERKFIFDN